MQTASNAVHQLIDRPGNLPDAHKHGGHANERTEQNRGENILIELISKAEHGAFRYKAAEDPIRISVGNVAVIELHAGDNGVNVLVAHLRVLDTEQIADLCFPQGKQTVLLMNGFIQRALADDGPVASVPLVNGQRVAGVLTAVQLPEGEIVIGKIAGGYLRADNAVYFAVAQQGNGIGNHPVVIQRMLL